MKIVGINGSPRGAKSQTLTLLKGVLDGAGSKGAQTELVDVCRLKIAFCNACDVCHKTGRCSKKDDFQGLYDKILEADGLIVSSPNYFRSVTAQLKAVIDRLSGAVHCQRLTGKYAASVATAGGPGQHRQVTDYLNRIMRNFGCFVSGSVGVAVAQGPEAFEKAERRAFKLGAALAEDVRARRDDPKQRVVREANRAYFRSLVAMRREDWGFEEDYWRATEES